MELCTGFEPGSNLPNDVCRLCGKSRAEHLTPAARTAVQAHIDALREERDALKAGQAQHEHVVNAIHDDYQAHIDALREERDALKAQLAAKEKK